MKMHRKWPALTISFLATHFLQKHQPPNPEITGQGAMARATAAVPRPPRPCVVLLLSGLLAACLLVDVVADRAAAGAAAAFVPPSSAAGHRQARRLCPSASASAAGARRRDKPKEKPRSPCFSSGPTRKRPGYSLASLPTATLGRSHRSPLCLARIQEALRLTREILGIPQDYLLALVPGGDTGAYEMAMWNLLSSTRPLDVLAWDAFGRGWYDDAVGQLRLPRVRLLSSLYGGLPDLAAVDGESDVCFVWNGTTSGVCLPHADWIPPASARKGLTLCDATSACFAVPLPWDKLDVTTFSWQKALGGEGAHGTMVLSPRALRRLEEVAPEIQASGRAIPKLFRMTDGKGKPLLSLFEGSTVNTPSMFCVEDYLDALAWVQREGGQQALARRSQANLQAIEAVVTAAEVEAKAEGREPWISFLAKDPATRSCTSVCLQVALAKPRLKAMLSLLEDEGVAFDVASYRDAPPGLRLWTGPTVETEEVERLLPWLRWAYEEVADG